MFFWDALAHKALHVPLHYEKLKKKKKTLFLKTLIKQCLSYWAAYSEPFQISELSVR